MLRLLSLAAVASVTATTVGAANQQLRGTWGHTPEYSGGYVFRKWKSEDYGLAKVFTPEKEKAYVLDFRSGHEKLPYSDPKQPEGRGGTIYGKKNKYYQKFKDEPWGEVIDLKDNEGKPYRPQVCMEIGPVGRFFRLTGPLVMMNHNR